MVYCKINEDPEPRAIIVYNQGLIPDDIYKLLETSTRSLSMRRSNQVRHPPSRIPIRSLTNPRWLAGPLSLRTVRKGPGIVPR